MACGQSSRSGSWLSLLMQGCGLAGRVLQSRCQPQVSSQNKVSSCWMECQCASDPFLCMMPVLPVFMVHSFILVTLERGDEYLISKQEFFSCEVMLLVGMLRERTELWCRVADRLWQALPWWHQLPVGLCPSRAGVGGCCSGEHIREGGREGSCSRSRGWPLGGQPL